MKVVLGLGMIFMIGVQPMVVISSLILIILGYSMSMYWGMGSYWLSYMLVLVMMSGVLVVFMYMMSFLPNESFEVFGIAFVTFVVILYGDYLGFGEFVQDISMGSMKIWGGDLLVSSMFLIVYLFFLMIMIVWVSMLDNGAIRIC